MLLTHINALKNKIDEWLDCFTDKEIKEFIESLEAARDDLDDV